MNRIAFGAIAVIAAAVIFLGLASTFTVHQSEQALVLQLGEPRRQVNEPGLHFKLPLIQNVATFDKRVLDFDAPTQEIPTLDQKQVLVNAFARFRITDPLKFYQSVTTEDGAQKRLGDIIYSNLRQALGAIPMSQILTDQRDELMRQITAEVSQEARPFGIEVLDVRMKRVDLPPENSEAVFRRMQTQREQEARGIRAGGQRDAQTIKAEADKQQVVIYANARREGEILRGQGDAEATAIYNAAYGKDPAFFDFFRSMQALRAGLTPDTTTFVGPPEGDFFRYFGSEAGGEAGGPTSVTEGSLPAISTAEPPAVTDQVPAAETAQVPGAETPQAPSE